MEGTQRTRTMRASPQPLCHRMPLPRASRGTPPCQPLTALRTMHAVVVTWVFGQPVTPANTPCKINCNQNLLSESRWQALTEEWICGKEFYLNASE